MTYGLNAALFIENGPASEAARASRMRSTDAFRAWRRIGSERRLELVTDALKGAANDDPFDNLPVAL
jgi:hypothetical protein